MRVLGFFVCFLLSHSIAFSQSDDNSKIENHWSNYLNECVVNGRVNYKQVVARINELESIIEQMETKDLSNTTLEERVAFYINAYNMTVIYEIAKVYPIPSVKEISGFFDRKKRIFGGQKLTLNELEKEVLFRIFPDPKLHFVLVCGAMDCPKILNTAISSIYLHDQLVYATTQSINDKEFIKYENDKWKISEIFNWYSSDFGGKKSTIVNFINSYKNSPKVEINRTSYYSYDWTLNDTKFDTKNVRGGNNTYRYVTSAAIPKGGVEVKIFNNLFRQTTAIVTNYFTTSISALYGLNNRLNIGAVARYRRVLLTGDRGFLEPFKNLSDQYGRQRFTAVGPQVRWAPKTKWKGFSIQSSLTFPIGKSLTGIHRDSPFIDWSGPVFIVQFFNDQSIGDNFSLFTEVDLLAEEIGGRSKANRVSFPITNILSWYPFKGITIYGLAGFSPYIVRPFDYFYQLGIGVKYQLSSRIEVELLVNHFDNRNLQQVGGRAATYNVGVRYSR